MRGICLDVPSKKNQFDIQRNASWVSSGDVICFTVYLSQSAKNEKSSALNNHAVQKFWKKVRMNSYWIWNMLDHQSFTGGRNIFREPNKLYLMQTLWLRTITLLSNFIPLCACVLSFVKSNIFEDVEYYGIPSSFLFCTVVHFPKIHQIKARWIILNNKHFLLSKIYLSFFGYIKKSNYLVRKI